MKVCQKAHLLFCMTKPRLSQAGALLFPKDFVPPASNPGTPHPATGSRCTGCAHPSGLSPASARGSDSPT